MTEPLQAQLLNAEGELVAEGRCWLDEDAGLATLEPERTPSVLAKERGALVLELESGRSFRVAEKPMIIRLRPRPNGADAGPSRALYRLRLTEHAQDADAVGAAGEGAPAVPTSGRPRAIGETPAAR